MVIIGPKDVAKRLDISERTATRLMRAGEIAAFRAGAKSWRTTELHLESYVRRKMDEERDRVAMARRPQRIAG